MAAEKPEARYSCIPPPALTMTPDSEVQVADQQGTEGQNMARTTYTVVWNVELGFCLLTFIFCIAMCATMNGGTDQEIRDFLALPMIDKAFDVLLPFFAARALDIFIDAILASVEYDHVEKELADGGAGVLVSSGYEKLLEARYWAVAGGKMLSAVTFFAAFWKLGWYSKSYCVSCASN